MSYGTVTVTNVATLIVDSNTKRRNLTIANAALMETVFIGPNSSITVANAIPLYGGSTRDQDRIAEGYLGPVYGIVAAGTADVRYWEVTQ